MSIFVTLHAAPSIVMIGKYQGIYTTVIHKS